MPRWKIEQLLRSLRDWAPAWDEQNQCLTGGHPMLDSRFVNALLRHFGDGSEHLCRLESGASHVGMCLLKPVRTGIWASFRPPSTQMGAVLLHSEAGLSDLPRHLPGWAGQVDFLCQDPAYSHLCREWAFPHRRMPHTLTMSIRLVGGFDAYWQRRSPHLHRYARKRENRLANAGLEPRMIRLAAPQAMRDAVRRFGMLETSGWKGRAGSAVSADNIQGQFYGDLLESFARTGQAAVFEYWLGEELAASELTLSSDHAILLLKTAYNEALGKYSPGRMLQREVIRDGFTRLPGGIIEFCTNASAEDAEWGTELRRVEHVTVYRGPTVQKLIELARKACGLAAAA